MDTTWFNLIDHSLRFEYCTGAVTSLPAPHSTGWRQLPFTLCAQILDGDMCLTMDVFPEKDMKGRSLHDAGFIAGRTAKHIIRDGRALIVPANVRHRIDKISTGVMTSRWAHFRVTILGNIDVLAWRIIPPVFKRIESARMGDICAELAKGAHSMDNIIMQKKLGFELVSIIAKGSTLRGNTDSFFQASQRLVPVLHAMQDMPSRHFTLQELARLTFLSPSRFHAVFTNALGMPPLKYLRQQRMDLAKYLLLATDCSIAEIAGKVSFEDEFHFSRLFKKTCGLSPRNYRRQIRGGLWKNEPVPCG